jgi:hypothetical protein
MAGQVVAHRGGGRIDSGDAHSERATLCVPAAADLPEIATRG